MRALALATLGIVGDGLLLGTLVTAAPAPMPWLLAHAAAAGASGAGLALLLAARTRTAPPRWLPPCIASCLALPCVGGLGLAGALLATARRANAIGERAPYWRLSAPVALPFSAPPRRTVRPVDGRGLGERLRHATPADTDAVYRRLLAAASMRDSLSVGALRAGVRHPDDRLRLTAYQTLDAKATRLNREIQRLEAGIERLDERADGARARSAAWLSVAANYRELLTLEEDEPVARRQLLERAVAAANRAVEARPSNRNAHLVLGRVRQMAGEHELARASFERAVELGMAPDTVAPRLAECAFARREFGRVREILAGVGDAHRAYPPLAAVAEYWR